MRIRLLLLVGDATLRPVVYRPSEFYGSNLGLYTSIVSVQGPPRLHIEPQKLLNFDLNVDSHPNPDFHSNADSDPDSKNKADPDPGPQPCLTHL
jgi:hypothetical protein